jgi:hypothetical protein
MFNVISSFSGNFSAGKKRGIVIPAITPPFENPSLSIGSAVTIESISPFAGGGNSYSFLSSVDSYIDVAASEDWA